MARFYTLRSIDIIPAVVYPLAENHLTVSLPLMQTLAWYIHRIQRLQDKKSWKITFNSMGRQMK